MAGMAATKDGALPHMSIDKIRAILDECADVVQAVCKSERVAELVPSRIEDARRLGILGEFPGFESF